MIKNLQSHVSSHSRLVSKLRLQTWPQLAVSLVLLVCALLVMHHVDPDFTQDYAAARGWQMGLDPNAHTADLLVACCPGVHTSPLTIQTAHPPLATLTMLPFSWLGWSTARLFWLFIGWAALVWSWRHVGVSFSMRIATFGFWLIALLLGAFEPIIFLLLTVAFSIRERKPDTAAVLLGFAAALKIYPAVLLIGLVLSRRYRMAALAICTALLVTLVPEVVLGQGVTAAWFEYAKINALNHADNVRNLSLVRIVRVLFPNVAPGVAAVFVGATLLLPLVPLLRRSDGLRPMLPVMLLVSPICWEQYLGYLVFGSVGWFERICLTISGSILTAIWLGLIPPDNLAPVAYGPLLLVLLLSWYRLVRLHGGGARMTSKEHEHKTSTIA